MPLSESQYHTLSFLTIPFSILSLIGSGLIIDILIRDKKHSPYRRLLFAMSCCDIISSINWSLQPFLVPSKTSNWPFAIGNDATCSIMGAVVQFSFANFWYAGMLSIYFLLVIYCNKTEQQISKWIEPTMHKLAIGFPLVTSIIGLIQGWYNENDIGPGCWINSYPDGCNVDNLLDDDTIPQCKSNAIGWIVAGYPCVATLLIIGVCNLMIYCHVRRIALGNNNNRATTTTTRTATATTTTTTSITGWELTQTWVAQQHRVRRIAFQCFLYVGAFLLSYTWPTILRALEGGRLSGENESSLYPLLVLQSIFLPLQGLFNLIIFIRPKYLRAKQDFPNESSLWCIHRSLYGSRVKPKNQPPSSDSRFLSPRHVSDTAAIEAGVVDPLPANTDDTTSNSDGQQQTTSSRSEIFYKILFGLHLNRLFGRRDHQRKFRQAVDSLMDGGGGGGGRVCETGGAAYVPRENMAPFLADIMLVEENDEEKIADSNNNSSNDDIKNSSSSSSNNNNDINAERSGKQQNVVDIVISTTPTATTTANNSSSNADHRKLEEEEKEEVEGYNEHRRTARE